MITEPRNKSETLTFSYQQTWLMLAAMTFRGILLLLPILIPLELVLFYGNQSMNGLLLLAGVAIIRNSQ